MSYLPKKGSLRDRICIVMLRKGEPMTVRQIADVFKGDKFNSITSSVSQLKHYGALDDENGFYTLKPHVLRHYGIDVPVVEKKLVLVDRFKPWSGKYSFANAPRREPIRDISFKVGSVGFPVGY